MDKHLIADRSNKHCRAVNTYTITKPQVLNTQWHLWCLHATVSALLLLVSSWSNPANALVTLSLLGMLVVYLTLRLYKQKANLSEQNTRCSEPSILSNSKRFCWLTLSVFLLSLLSNPTFQLFICFQLFVSLGLAILANKLIQRSNSFSRY